MVSALSASTRRLCANNPPALNAVSLWITSGRGDLSRTRMGGFKVQALPSFPWALCHSGLQCIRAADDMKAAVLLKKGRHDAVTSSPAQQINSMLFSQDVQGMYWSCDKWKPLVKFCISKAGDEKWWNWRTCVVGPGWLKASSPQTEPRIKRTESLLSPCRTVCCWRLVQDGWKCCDWKEKWNI